MKIKILMIIVLLSFGTVKNLNAQCPHTPKCVFDSCYYGGAGTEIEPYQIWSKEHLEELADSVNNGVHWSAGKYFKVMNDITDPLGISIGYEYWQSSAPHLQMYSRTFQGNFDGQGYTIRLEMNGLARAGLFGTITAITTDIEIKNIVIDGIVNGNVAGGIAAVAGGVAAIHMLEPKMISMSNLINNAKISSIGGDDIAGGIIGYANKRVTASACINLGTVNGGYATGGIIGFIYANAVQWNAESPHEIIINECSNHGFIQGNNGVGGISGRILHLYDFSTVTILNNYSSGVVVGTSNVGCIVGLITGNGTVINNHYDKQMCGTED